MAIVRTISSSTWDYKRGRRMLVLDNPSLGLDSKKSYIEIKPPGVIKVVQLIAVG